jgi:HAD superfamily hydrolase (TIGR01484 family)
MQPLSRVPKAHWRNVRGILTDVDGTLTTGPKVTAATYAAIQTLAERGFLVIPITGGPAGMCMTMARMWPVSAVVGESGAFYFRHMATERKMIKRFWFDQATRTKHHQQIAAARDAILRAVPRARIAADQGYREDDLAIDWAEDVGPLTAEEVAQVKAIMHTHGLKAHQSSIHVNGWIGDYSKLAMTKLLLQEQFGIDLDTQREEFVYVGDAPNDCEMFAHLPFSIGVANITQYGDAVNPLPAYVSRQGYGAGFEEVVQLLIGH